VAGHFEATHPWLPYHEQLRAPAARLVGARPEETVAMNSLTVNLHLMMASFYRPAGDRTRILIEDNAFPSDSYAVRSQAAFHGLDPDQAVVRVPAAAIVDYLARYGDQVALVLLGGVNYLTGEVLDIPGITAAGHAAGCRVGWDLAHAVGNIPLRLHDWGVDFAVWCSYKYLNAGPGAVAGCFVHSRHLTDATLPRLAGWWGSDPATRFLMRPVAEPVSTADAWQVSNPPILAMAPVRVSLEMFDQVGMGGAAGQERAADRVPRLVADRAACDHPGRSGPARLPALGAGRRRRRGGPRAARGGRRHRGRARAGHHPVGAGTGHQVVIGADGANSAVRQAVPTFQHRQDHLDYGYRELTIPPVAGDFALDPGALHIWPRGTSMMIALPNPDRSFTATLFWPHRDFAAITDPAAHFREHYPDAYALMPDLTTEYARNPVGSLVTVYCWPWAHQGRVALLGDAAHAILPFYGQGANCAFEDCVELDRCLAETGDAWPEALEAYQWRRKENTDAIAEMALENFVEMRDKVGSRAFLWRKRIEHALERALPGRYMTRYELVSFTTVPYAQIRRRNRVRADQLPRVD
jgi:kynureninase